MPPLFLLYHQLSFDYLVLYVQEHFKQNDTCFISWLKVRLMSCSFVVMEVHDTTSSRIKIILYTVFLGSLKLWLSINNKIHQEFIHQLILTRNIYLQHGLWNARHDCQSKANWFTYKSIMLGLKLNSKPQWICTRMALDRAPSYSLELLITSTWFQKIINKSVYNKKWSIKTSPFKLSLLSVVLEATA